MKSGFHLPHVQQASGFTLAELLIALAILGVIATFTIPKVLNSQQNGKFKAIAKEDMSVVSAAYQQYVLTNGYNANIGLKDLTPYMNYVTVDTSGAQVDDDQASGTYACTPTWPCLRLHNGSTLSYPASDTFVGTSTTDAVFAHIDPDGQVNANSKAVAVFLYYNGRLTDEGNIINNTCGAYNPDPSKVPPWFTW